jgi:uncharacterized protein YicC (UPF0701 family)
MFENKRIPNPISHYKLEFDIKTGDENILKVIEKIQELVVIEFNNTDLVAEVMPTMTKLDIEEEKDVL